MTRLPVHLWFLTKAPLSVSKDKKWHKEGDKGLGRGGGGGRPQGENPLP